MAADKRSALSRNKGNDKSVEIPNDILLNGVSEDEEENFSDPEDFVDDIADDELLGELLKQKPKETDGVESVIVVDGVPVVGPDRLPKLQNIISKIFVKFGRIVSEHYPEENGKTKGYIFLEYSNPHDAKEAVKLANGYKLDKAHTFIVNLFTDFDIYLNIPDEWSPPEPQPYKDPGNLQSWLMDPDGCDQYSVISEGGESTSIYVNSIPEPTLLEQKVKWTETYVRWSPKGTYLATFHQKGIALWGGEKFERLARLAHVGVQFADFSPNESFLVTFSPLLDHSDDQQSIFIWDVRTGVMRRGFQCDRLPVWPVFKWSHDDRYFARLQQDPDSLGSKTLSIYETSSFSLLDKRSLKIPGIKDFSWSPSDNVIAYWVGEDKDVPARVTLIEVPSKNEIRVKNLFSVADCKMHWQKTGDFLCVKVDRYSKLRKDKTENKYIGTYTNFEIFHMRHKEIPVDSVEIKEVIIAFAWEPVGTKFCIIHGESPNTSVSFYGVKSGSSVSLVKKLEKKQCNHVFWCPTGQFIVLAGLRSMSGILEFLDTSDMTVMATNEHFMATDVEWDPSGRYVVTAVSWWGYKVDNAYILWSFQGRILQRHLKDRFCQLLWRPRPPSLMTRDQLKEVNKNLKKYSAQFEKKDRLSQSKASKEQIERRKKMMKDYEDYRKKQETLFAKQKQRRMALRNNTDTDELYNKSEGTDKETVEFCIKETTTILDE